MHAVCEKIIENYDLFYTLFRKKKTNIELSVGYKILRIFTERGSVRSLDYAIFHRFGFYL